MFSIDQLRLDIERLLLDYPDLADDEILRADMLDGETNIKDVLTTLVAAIDDHKTLTEAISARTQQLAGRRARFARRTEFLRELVLKVLQAADLKKIELAEATLSQRATQPQIIGEVEADQLPDELCKITREPSRTKIREALLKGEVIPGLALSNSPPTLTINTK
ncbi:hypothetical protein ABID65_006674 [Bradyrhizobium sp. S3.9.2]|uniref:siphovirus Gp157 family protein n=1 Tax=Bradyrhizobium sp. S3.9.2 TaxID=3156432 RepID=UPI003396BE60